MSKVLKSVRIDQNIISFAEEYIKLVGDSFGLKTSLSQIINNAIPEYIEKQSGFLISISSNNQINYVNEKGTLSELHISDEEIEKLIRIHDNSSAFLDYFSDEDR